MSSIVTVMRYHQDNRDFRPVSVSPPFSQKEREPVPSVNLRFQLAYGMRSESMRSLLIGNVVIKIEVDRLLVNLPSSIRIATQNLSNAPAPRRPRVHDCNDDPIIERVFL